MITPFSAEDPALDAEIARVYTHLSTFSAEDEEYQKAVDQLTKLYKLRQDQGKLNLELYQFDGKHELEVEQHEHERDDAAKSWFQRVEPSTVVTVFGNLAIALIVVKYEQTGVIRTAAKDFIKKI